MFKQARTLTLIFLLSPAVFAKSTKGNLWCAFYKASVPYQNSHVYDIQPCECSPGGPASLMKQYPKHKIISEEKNTNGEVGKVTFSYKDFNGVFGASDYTYTWYFTKDKKDCTTAYQSNKKMIADEKKNQDKKYDAYE